MAAGVRSALRVQGPCYPKSPSGPSSLFLEGPLTRRTHCDCLYFRQLATDCKGVLAVTLRFAWLACLDFPRELGESECSGVQPQPLHEVAAGGAISFRLMS
jgi:hypothetical protein